MVGLINVAVKRGLGGVRPGAAVAVRAADFANAVDAGGVCRAGAALVGRKNWETVDRIAPALCRVFLRAEKSWFWTVSSD